MVRHRSKPGLKEAESIPAQKVSYPVHSRLLGVSRGCRNVVPPRVLTWPRVGRGRISCCRLDQADTELSATGVAMF